MSQPCKCCGHKTQETNLQHLGKRICANSDKLGGKNPSIYKLRLQKHGSGRRYSFGMKTNRNFQSKTIMVLGATGAGKSMLINGMINYILGVEWKDDFRFKLIDEGTAKSQTESQTSHITAYEIKHQKGFKVPYSVIIIDTPGFGDTKGITRDKAITDQIREFLSYPDGVDSIDAVCFVTQASLARLTHSQKYIFDSVLSIFGNDIKENILMMITFADSQKPPVLEAIAVSGIPCPKDKKGDPVHFKFNNSALFANNLSNRESGDGDDESEDENFDSMFWRMGMSSMKNFFSSLNRLESCSLLLTKEVLKERKQLEAAVEGLQPQIQAGLVKVEELRKTQQILEQHEAEIEAHKDFEFEVEIIVPRQKDITKTGNYITNCQKCHFTCHYPCRIPNDDGKSECNAMDHSGKCKVCPGKCIWNVHFNQKYGWEYVSQTEKRTAQEIKAKYEKANGGKLSAQQLFQNLEDEFLEVQDKVLELIEKSSACIKRLEEIALKLNPLSTPEYIDLLIATEKEERKPGFMTRIESLNQVKEQAVLMTKVANKEDLLPKEWEQYREVQKRKKGIKDHIIDFLTSWKI
ncbi:uncharacterized protein LOC122787397 [Protopterus annectens]|uniref:uncharacterized protein LOC122787397 n=1 Tax=Protopterus annectens TaxID=7888 RepID=UPI001CFBC286|nr:uncharacterized protein LOC122787397 [Protopterus annectens]